ncbi:MAG: hypothetical protein NT004_07070 [Bacteroidetes bacterium]|nr:hypothetical protein [Bacteroidota bacterium]
MKNTIGRLTTYTAAIILLGFGLVYLLRNSFMPYHSEAISLEWGKVEPATQFLFLAFMRAISGGFIATAVAIIFLQYKLQVNKLSWIPLLILTLGTISMLCTLYAIMIVSVHTPGRPPFGTDMIGEALLLVGFVFNRRYLLKQKSG